jgi:hypothetical protein
LKLEPGPPRHFHLRPQAHQAANFDRFHAPEVDGIPDPEVHRVAPPSAESHTPNKSVGHATQAPQGVECEPAFTTAERGKFGKDLTRWYIDLTLTP